MPRLPEPERIPNESLEKPIIEPMSHPQTFETVLASVRSEPSFREHLSQWSRGDVDALIGSNDFEDFVRNRSSLEEIVEASGGEGFDFEIEIRSFGPFYWISAPEFDDIGYFSKPGDALEHAEEVYGPYIETLAELREAGEEE
jgi:hypothetical protein